MQHGPDYDPVGSQFCTSKSLQDHKQMGHHVNFQYLLAQNPNYNDFAAAFGASGSSTWKCPHGGKQTKTFCSVVLTVVSLQWNANITHQHDALSRAGFSFCVTEGYNYRTTDPKQFHKPHMKFWRQAKETSQGGDSIPDQGTTSAARQQTRPETRERQHQRGPFAAPQPRRTH